MADESCNSPDDAIAYSIRGILESIIHRTEREVEVKQLLSNLPASSASSCRI